MGRVTASNDQESKPTPTPSAKETIETTIRLTCNYVLHTMAQPSHTLLAQYSTRPAKFLLDSLPMAALGDLLSILFSTATSVVLVL
jgi:hypothetical protein